MKQTNELIFNPEETESVIKTLEIKTKVIEKNTFLLDDNKEIATCHTCKNKISTKNLGHIAAGSKILFCDNPECFSAFLVEKKLK